MQKRKTAFSAALQVALQPASVRVEQQGEQLHQLQRTSRVKTKRSLTTCFT